MFLKLVSWASPPPPPLDDKWIVTPINKTNKKPNFQTIFCNEKADLGLLCTISEAWASFLRQPLPFLIFSWSSRLSRVFIFTYDVLFLSWWCESSNSAFLLTQLGARCDWVVFSGCKRRRRPSLSPCLTAMLWPHPPSPSCSRPLRGSWPTMPLSQIHPIEETVSFPRSHSDF